MADQRPAVDDLIKDLWDTIEFNLRNEEASSLRRKAREWGVVYDGDDEVEVPRPCPPVSAGTTRKAAGNCAPPPLPLLRAGTQA